MTESRGLSEATPRGCEKPVVDWDGPDDPQSPMNFSPARKWITIALISLSSFNTGIVSTIFAPGVPQVLDEFDSHDSALSSFMVSVFVIGSIFGPLVSSPLSECYGRLPIMHVSNFGFTLASILCAASINMPMLIVARLLMGIVGAVPQTIGGGFIADLVETEKRGTALTIWTVGPLLGLVLGPIIGGYITLGVGWRWTVWPEAILGGLISFMSLWMKETYGPVILTRKTARLQRETGTAYKSPIGEEQTAAQMLGSAISRPIRLLLHSPMVLPICLYSSISYSYLYICLTTFTPVFEGEYGFNAGEAGLAYLGLGVGLCIAQYTLSQFSDRYIRRQQKIHGSARPEDRLLPLIPGVCAIPIGLFWYGWSAQYHLHWMVPIAGTVFIGLGIIYIQVCAQLYLIDVFNKYAASAVSANVMVRAVFATVLPLAGPPLYSHLGLGWGNSLLGFIAVGLAPLSIFIVRYRPKQPGISLV